MTVGEMCGRRSINASRAAESDPLPFSTVFRPVSFRRYGFADGDESEMKHFRTLKRDYMKQFENGNGLWLSFVLLLIVLINSRNESLQFDQWDLFLGAA